MGEQLSLFSSNDNSTAADEKERDLCALDEMFRASRRYRSSREYMELLKFISKFRRYAPFNCLLLHIQNPDISYVASGGDWERQFRRKPKRDARPLVILQPFGPVMFVYDIQDTEGASVPEYVLKPFDTQGKLSRSVFQNTVHN